MDATILRQIKALLPHALALVLLVALMACGDSDSTPKAEEPTTASATEEAGPERTPELGSPATDREILVAIYNALDGPSWTDSENWLSDVPFRGLVRRRNLRQWPRKFVAATGAGPKRGDSAGVGKYQPERSDPQQQPVEWGDYVSV